MDLNQVAGISQPPPLPPGFDKWLYSPEELAASPSVRDGFTPAEEGSAHRDSLEFIASFIQVFGAPDMKPRDLLGTAVLIYHRFFIRRSLKNFDRLEIAAATVMLAAKMMNRSQYVKVYATKLVERRERRTVVLDDHSETFFLLRTALVTAERALLSAMEYDFTSDIGNSSM